jgi:hypothetical protein
MRTTLSRSDYENFLIQAYFGVGCFDEPLLACIDRAYLDFSRTLRLKNSSGAEKLHKDVRTWLAREIGNLPRRSNTITQEGFDSWHRAACVSLISRFGASNLSFYAGQGQKWINMTFKYVFTLGDTRISGYSEIYKYCHAPIDRIVIERLERLKSGFPRLSKPWSRIDYGEYRECQQWIRGNFDVPPLDVELRAWQKPEFDLCSIMRVQQAK